MKFILLFALTLIAFSEANETSSVDYVIVSSDSKDFKFGESTGERIEVEDNRFNDDPTQNPNNIPETPAPDQIFFLHKSTNSSIREETFGGANFVCRPQ